MLSRPLAFACSFIISLSAFFFLHAAAAQDFGGLDGIWEGTLNVVKAPGWSYSQTNPTRETRLVIRGNSAQAFQFQQGKILEIKPGKFKIERLETNAIIFAINSGSDSDGKWVQNWLYAVTEKDRDTLIVNLYAMANNLAMPLSNSSSKWSMAATGELKRVK